MVYTNGNFRFECADNCAERSRYINILSVCAKRKCILIWTATPEGRHGFQVHAWHCAHVFTYTIHTIYCHQTYVHHTKMPRKKGKCKSSQENKSFGSVQCYSMRTHCTFSPQWHMHVYAYMSFYFPVDSLIYLFSPQLERTQVCVKQLTYYLLSSYRRTNTVRAL